MPKASQWVSKCAVGSIRYRLTLNEVMDRQTELEKAMTDEMAKNGYDLFVELLQIF